MHDPFDYFHVVFDWNGTVIDDVGLALTSLNAIRIPLGLADVTLEDYRHHFRFPIHDFYADLGFDFARCNFSALVTEYLAQFDARVGDCELCPGVLSLVTALHAQGTRISILSASHQDTLHQTAQRNGIGTYIDHLFGLENCDATGKLDRARELDQQLERMPADRVLMIGDTDHDAQVARDRGWDFLAVATGHQSADRLLALGVPVSQTLAHCLPEHVD